MLPLTIFLKKVRIGVQALSLFSENFLFTFLCTDFKKNNSNKLGWNLRYKVRLFSEKVSLSKMSTRWTNLSFLTKRIFSGVRFSLKCVLFNFSPDSSHAMSLSYILISRKLPFVDQKTLQNFLTQTDSSPQGVFVVIELFKWKRKSGDILYCWISLAQNRHYLLIS